MTMMPVEMAELYRACGPQPLSVTIFMLADRMRVLTLNSGRSPQSPAEWEQLVREVAEATRVKPIVEGELIGVITRRDQLRVAPHPSWKSDPTCSTCDHVHEGREECEYYMGEGKFCHCSERVTR